jgi:uncharacterized membrane protein
MQMLMLFYLGGGILLILLALPLVLRRIKPVRMFVLRFEGEQEGKEKWYQATAYTGSRLMTAGISIVLAALILYLWPGLDLNAETYVLSVTGVIVGLLLWAVLQSYLFIKSLA